LLAVLERRFGTKVDAPLGDPRARLGGLDAVAPGRVVEVHPRALEGERVIPVSLDDLALGGPLAVAVAVVPLEGGTHRRTLEPVAPLARVALLGPSPHAADVGDGVVGLLGRRSDVTGDLEPARHGTDLIKPRAPARSGGAWSRSGARCVLPGRSTVHE